MIHDSFCRCRQCKPPMTTRMDADYPPTVSAQLIRGMVLGAPLALMLWVLIYYGGRHLLGV